MQRFHPAPNGRRRQRQAGFTLVEILIVIALIGALAALAIGNLGGVFGKNQVKIARIFVNDSIRLPLTEYRIDLGSYPNTEQGLAALVTAPPSAGSKWQGPYGELTKVPEDPWNNPYQYKYPGEKNPSGAKGYDIWSMGEDGQSGTADDIGNWE